MIAFVSSPYRGLRVALMAAASLALHACLTACHGDTHAEPVSGEAVLQGAQLIFPAGHPQLRLLKLEPARPSSAVDVALSAKLVWNEDRTQRLYPAFAGRVERIAADVGSVVKPGSLLAALASPDFGAAQADAARAEADHALTARQLQRQRELLAAGIVARRDVEQAEADAARAEAEQARAHARVRLYGGGSGVDQQLALRSSIGGVVVERNLNPGQELRPDQSGPGVPALFVVSDPSTLWVQIDARESEVGTLKPGSAFELEVPAYPGRRFTGQVTALADAIDPQTRTVKVRGRVDNAERLLKAEMLATAHVQRHPGEGVVVPASAVLLRGEKHWVFVSPKQGVFEAREVEQGAASGQQVVLRRGLEAGEQVVTDNALLLDRQMSVAQASAQPASAKASQQ
ncbi:efflux RND transporter periplasmic adaptor subunit [Roseateles cellulosilyticus]|uniref:Efflux RND transporter periplasmic adaptor subunit n=1 Tax=Pelomonas cellulosilytica TaxID=2906762 RepID=A0ABS8XYJ6_9BURK|nr:efflux RND transporter periplasmic adaptor subunit [Pelomonas sp. P8]MCE4557709.1 efflux RND transporter periplasmic adaptor subunit [Pelomonas sp. P8]